MPFPPKANFYLYRLLPFTSHQPGTVKCVLQYSTYYNRENVCTLFFIFVLFLQGTCYLWDYSHRKLQTLMVWMNICRTIFLVQVVYSRAVNRIIDLTKNHYHSPSLFSTILPTAPHSLISLPFRLHVLLFRSLLEARLLSACKYSMIAIHGRYSTLSLSPVVFQRSGGSFSNLCVILGLLEDF